MLPFPDWIIAILCQHTSSSLHKITIWKPLTGLKSHTKNTWDYKWGEKEAIAYINLTKAEYNRNLSSNDFGGISARWRTASLTAKWGGFS